MNKIRQRDGLLITIKRYPSANEIRFDPVPNCDSRHGKSGLRALLEDLVPKGFQVELLWPMAILTLRVIAPA